MPESMEPMPDERLENSGGRHRRPHSRRYPAIMETGVSGIALSGTILQAKDPEKETKKIIDLLNKYRKA